ncbi:MAG: hypothetical protein H6823_10720 [Planctomycetaceae bacterium]|nr:hypothetical protein [Planctomycetaceae bacterium]
MSPVRRLRQGTRHPLYYASGSRLIQGRRGRPLFKWKMVLLDLSSLTSLTSNSQGWTTYFRAYGGGTLLMPNLTALTNHSVTVRAEGSGSQIDLSGLTTWQGSFPTVAVQA